MATKTTKWDAADYLDTPQDIAHYIEACIQDDPGDGSLIRTALGDVARAKGMTQIARDCGVGRESLYKALSIDGNPELSTVIKLLRSLGLRLAVKASTARG
jgi:probable addiction module antidote protein